MRTKSKYRKQYRDGGRVDPQTELPSEPPAEQPAETVSTPPEAPPAPAVDSQPATPPQPPQAEQPPKDDTATLALKRQIEGLRSAELHRQQAAQAAMPQQPMSREARLAAWQAEGISPAEVQFFQTHPQMVDYPQITGLAVHRAKEAGLERDTAPFFAFVEKAFNAQVEHLMQSKNNPRCSKRQHFSNHHRDHRHDQRQPGQLHQRTGLTFSSERGGQAASHTRKGDVDAFRSGGSQNFRRFP